MWANADDHASGAIWTKQFPDTSGDHLWDASQDGSDVSAKENRESRLEEEQQKSHK